MIPNLRKFYILPLVVGAALLASACGEDSMQGALQTTEPAPTSTPGGQVHGSLPEDCPREGVDFVELDVAPYPSLREAVQAATLIIRVRAGEAATESTYENTRVPRTITQAQVLEVMRAPTERIGESIEVEQVGTRCVVMDGRILEPKLEYLLLLNPGDIDGTWNPLTNRGVYQVVEGGVQATYAGTSDEVVAWEFVRETIEATEAPTLERPDSSGQ